MIALAVVLGGTAPASAHPTLLFSDPPAGTAVPDSPPVINLVFNESVTVGGGAISVTGDGGDVALSAASTAQDGRMVTARTEEELGRGTYVVRWRVTGADGDLMEDEFRFAVGAALSGASVVGDGGSGIAWIDALLRWLMFAGLAVALGGVAAERFTASARAEKPALCPLTPWTLPGALVGLGAVAGLAARLVTDAGAASALWQGRVGQLLLTEVAAFTLALGLVVIGRRGWTVVPLLVVAAAEGLRSHVNVAAPGWGALLTGVHVAAVAVWLGALLHMARAAHAWRRERLAVLWVFLGYVRLAAWVFVLVIGTGAVSALLLVPLSAVFSTTYGQVLLVKLGLVVLAAGVALTARVTVWRRERLARAHTLVRLESAVLVVVLAASAVLVSTPPVGSQAAAPPPARGLEIPLGALAGQVGVTAAASEGQLVVRLSTPRRGDYYAPEEQQDYTLWGVVAAGAEDFPLAFRGCGESCFVAPADWRAGENVVTLRAGAEGWRGGAVGLLVPWPVQPGGGELERVVTAMRALDRLTVYEAVTSDTSERLPTPQRLDLAGTFFLAQEPYASGVAPIAVRISRDDEPMQLALGFPAASTTVRLTLDDQGRISEETLTDGSHLIHRRFVYP
ncbi:copper resistance protein CopC [Prauserella oleivorans]|uniref:Copper resistance protein CopC n=1 Tax=Prauserella oleivorans TaxID=1478153 RepID=A0ABW5WFG8_9PSEU